MSAQLEITIPAGFTNQHCTGCIGIAGVYTLSHASFTHFPCGGGQAVVVGVGDHGDHGYHGYLHHDVNQCAVGGMYVHLALLTWLATDGANRYWRTVLRLEGIAGFTSICQDWMYKSARMPVDAVGLAGPIALRYVDGTGCHGETSGGSFACNLCNNPPASLTLEAA